MQQYEAAKAACDGAVLLFRMGDFYELFNDDAKIAARVLGLTLTSREKTSANPVPMAGFPYHQLDSYLAKLIGAGYRGAVCEQVEDPKKATGLVKREVTRVVTAGTLTDDALLDPRLSNFLAAICYESPSARSPKDGRRAGFSWAELSTGRFLATVVPENRVADLLACVSPSEFLIAEDRAEDVEHLHPSAIMTCRPPWSFNARNAAETLQKHFGTANLEGLGFSDDDEPAIQAAGAVLEYLHETQKASLSHLDRLLPFNTASHLQIDEASRRSLELTSTIRDGGRDGSLLAILDHCQTSMGSRQLADWLNSPLTDLEQIDDRLRSVDELHRDSARRRELREQLNGVYDLQRLISRVVTGRASPRDLAMVARTLSQVPALKTGIEDSAGLLHQLHERMDPCPNLHDQLKSALVDDCPLTARDGGIIRVGYNVELDRLRELAAGGKKWIASYQAQIGESAGIPNLKVGYNKVFGYYIEVTNAHREKVPESFIRKQTLKNAERYITPELKEYEEQVVSADDKAKELEYDLFLFLREEVQQAAQILGDTAEAISQLDVLTSFAELAASQGYCRPTLSAEPTFDVRDGRHPVLDVIEPQGTFVPNDIQFSDEHGVIQLITGPNMAGKSTFIRQVALLTVMAQMGSFVPARSATVGIADRIFARVGASDELSRGQSTFMVEMTETARILNTASSRSLVILDEIGRGTSTYDGVSLAWAIVEHIHDHLGCRTFFATHYHELTDLADSLSGVENLNVSVKEWDDNVVFLHKIVPGSADKSYGIHVARLAGVPQSVIERAKQILSQLEHEHLGDESQPRISIRTKHPRRDIQLTLFANEEHPIIDEIRTASLDTMTPLQALQKIQAWKEKL